MYHKVSPEPIFHYSLAQWFVFLQQVLTWRAATVGTQKGCNMGNHFVWTPSGDGKTGLSSSQQSVPVSW